MGSWGLLSRFAPSLFARVARFRHYIMELQSSDQHPTQQFLILFKGLRAITVYLY